MDEATKKAALADIDSALSDATADAGDSIAIERMVRHKACIERLAPKGSSYRDMANAVELFPEKTYQKSCLLALACGCVRAPHALQPPRPKHPR